MAHCVEQWQTKARIEAESHQRNGSERERTVVKLKWETDEAAFTASPIVSDTSKAAKVDNNVRQDTNTNTTPTMTLA